MQRIDGTVSDHVLGGLDYPAATLNPSSYKTHLKLTISHLAAKDYGPYRCVAKNPRGETDGTIKIYRESNLILLDKN